MAPPRKPLTELETPGAVGFKTTSLRLQGAQWAQMDLFARAMGISANEFVQKAVDAYLRHVAKKPEVQTALKRQINQQRRMLDNLMKMAGVDGDAAIVEDDEEEVDAEEVLDAFEEVDDDED
jgi:cell division FtsZ-interacting protein ZapD